MKITKIDIFQVDLPLKEPFIIAYDSYDVIPAVLIKMHTNEGVFGYGESVADEHVTGESIYSVVQTLQHILGPALIGKDPRNIKQIHQLMDAKIIGNGAAKAAIDIACYDILGKYSNLPIYALLGGRKVEQPRIPKVLSILEPETLARQAKEAVLEGYLEIKMKLSQDPAKDIERVKAVREAIGEKPSIRVDVNQGWQSVQVAAQTIRALEPYNVSWIEQPISQGDVSFFKLLKEKVNTPLMADESMINAESLRTFIKDRSIDYLNIKLMKSGGIYPAYHLATQAELFGIRCQIGSMVESSIASAAGFHVALSKENIISTEISGPTKFTKDPGNLSYDLPAVQMTDQPGLGIDVDEAKIKEMCRIQQEVMSQ